MRMHSFSADQTCVIFSWTLLLKLCKFPLNSTCILVVSYRVNSPFLPYDLLEGRRIDDVTICFFCHTKKNRVYVAVGLFSNRLQKTLKCSRNSGDARYRQRLVCHFYVKYSTGIKTMSWWVEREGVNEAAGKGRKGGGGVELQSKFHQVTISNHIAIISLMILSSGDSTNGKVSVLRLSIPLKNLSF